MPPRAGAAVALALLAGPGLAAGLAPPAVELRWLLAPEAAPAEGEALAAHLAIQGPPGARLELRAWLSGPGIGGAQVWDGQAWQRADRYHLAWTLDDAGRARGWVAVRAAEGAGPMALQVRARDAAGHALAEARLDLAVGAGPQRAGLAPGPVVGAWLGERLVALAPVHPFAGAPAPWGVPGRYALQAPPEATLRSVGLDGALGAGVEPPGPADVRIASLLIDPSGGEEAEFVRIANRGDATVPLAGWHLDGPGWRAVFASGSLDPGQTRTLARNASAYAGLTGRGDTLAEVRFDGMMQLPNVAGTIALRQWGEAVDAVAWGRAGLPVPPSGMALRRTASGDWDPQPWNAGWGERAPLTASAQVAPFTTSDALGVAAGALAAAEREVLLATYTFTSPPLAGALHAALARGVRVRVLVEGAPVGGLPDAEGPLLDGLAAAGADVRRIGGSGRDRYGAMHAKYAVVDGASLLLGSENWTPSGFPETGQGNLGWGALVRSGAVAGEFRSVWLEDADLARGDVRAWPRAAGGARSDPPPSSAAGAAPAFVAGDATALLVPDDARDEVLALLGRAEVSLDLEALQLPAVWADGPNPVMEALHEAARRGVRVRALLDGAPDNDAAARAMDAWAGEEGLAVEARLSRAARVHNKGVIVDGAEALVGSINFGQAAMTRNREAALRFTGPPVAHWSAAFEADWQASGEAGSAPQADPHLLAAPLALMALAGVWRGRRRKR